MRQYEGQFCTPIDSVRDLAKNAGVGTTTIVRFENEKTLPVPATLKVIRQAFEEAGVEFTNGPARGAAAAEEIAARSSVDRFSPLVDCEPMNNRCFSYRHRFMLSFTMSCRQKRLLWIISNLRFLWIV
jgi:transcriptional regulator with XRE-family HTH domain